MWTQFDDQIDAQFRQRADAFAELHGLARMTTPVLAIKPLVRCDNAARDIAHQRHGRRRDRNVLIRLFQGIQHGFYQSAVEGLVSGQRPDGHLFGLETLRYHLHCRGGAANDLMNAVVNGEAQTHVVG